MTDCNSLWRGTSKLLELVPFDLFNKLCSKHRIQITVSLENILKEMSHIKVMDELMKQLPFDIGVGIGDKNGKGTL